MDLALAKSQINAQKNQDHFNIKSSEYKKTNFIHGLI